MYKSVAQISVTAIIWDQNLAEQFEFGQSEVLGSIVQIYHPVGFKIVQVNLYSVLYLY